MSMEGAARDVTDRVLSDPLRSPHIADIMRRLDDGYFEPAGLVDAVGQGERDRFMRAVFFARVWDLLTKPEAVILEVHIGWTPRRDADEDVNQAILDAALPDAFTASVGGFDNDGTLGIPQDQTSVKSVALEIGTTPCWRTHLLAETGVARWPYGSETIWILTWRKATDALKYRGDVREGAAA